MLTSERFADIRLRPFLLWLGLLLLKKNRKYMFGDMMGKLQEMQQRMEESKKRLDTIFVDAESPNGMVKVTFTGNKKVKSVTVSPDLLQNNDAEELEDHLIIAMNKGLEAAEKVWESEMKGMAGGLLPGL